MSIEQVRIYHVKWSDEYDNDGFTEYFRQESDADARFEALSGSEEKYGNGLSMGSRLYDADHPIVLKAK
jgi:hypothetical protein